MEVITSQGETGISKLKEAWSYRSLLFALAWRDIKVKYVQSYLGFLWIIINPLVSLFLLNFIFGTVMKVDTDNNNNLLFIISGLAGWNYFASLAAEAGNSLLHSQHMIKKIYFPKIVLPLSKSLTCLFELMGTIVVLVVCFIITGTAPSANIIYLPFFLLLSILSGFAFGIWISALTIRFRDLRFVVPFFIRIGFFITPIAYSSTMIPEKYQFSLYLNPMAGVVDGFRWSLLGSGEVGSHVFSSFILISVLLILGIIFFFRMEKGIADII